MRRLLLFAFLASFLMPHAEARAFSASYEQTISGGGMEEPQTSTITIKGDKMRIEADSPRGRVVSIMNGKVVYSYFPDEKKAAKYTVQSTPKMDALANYDKYLESLGAVIIGQETIGVHECDIYQFKDPKTRMMSKAWVWKAKKFPIRVEAEGPDGVFVTEIKGLQVDIDIDDSEFEIPGGVEIIEMQ